MAKVQRISLQRLVKPYAGVFLALLLPLGCALPQDKSPPPQAYLLEVGTFIPVTHPATNRILLVTVPRAAPGFDSNRIAYSKEPLKLDYYSQNLWSDAPAKMLLPILISAFEGTGAFKAVMSPPAAALSDLRVDVDLIRLQHEFMVQPSAVRLTLRIKVVDMKGGQVLGTHVFETLEPAPSENAYGAARAANAAVQKLLAAIVPFVLQHLDPPKQPAELSPDR